MFQQSELCVHGQRRLLELHFNSLNICAASYGGIILDCILNYESYVWEVLAFVADLLCVCKDSAHTFCVNCHILNMLSFLHLVRERTKCTTEL